MNRTIEDLKTKHAKDLDATADAAMMAEKLRNADWWEIEEEKNKKELDEMKENHNIEVDSLKEHLRLKGEQLSNIQSSVEKETPGEEILKQLLKVLLVHESLLLEKTKRSEQTKRKIQDELSERRKESCESKMKKAQEGLANIKRVENVAVEQFNELFDRINAARSAYHLLEKEYEDIMEENTKGRDLVDRMIGTFETIPKRLPKELNLKEEEKPKEQPKRRRNGKRR